MNEQLPFVPTSLSAPESRVWSRIVTPNAAARPWLSTPPNRSEVTPFAVAFSPTHRAIRPRPYRIDQGGDQDSYPVHSFSSVYALKPAGMLTTGKDEEPRFVHEPRPPTSVHAYSGAFVYGDLGSTLPARGTPTAAFGKVFGKDIRSEPLKNSGSNVNAYGHRSTLRTGGSVAFGTTSQRPTNLHVMSRTGLISAIRTDPTPPSSCRATPLSSRLATPKTTPVLKARPSLPPVVPRIDLPSATAMKEAEALLSLSPHAIEDLDPLESSASTKQAANAGRSPPRRSLPSAATDAVYDAVYGAVYELCR